MKLFEIFSRRNKLVKTKDIYEYDKISSTFRNQFVHLILKLLPNETHKAERFWDEMEQEINIELGLLNLKNGQRSMARIFNYYLNCEDVQALDIMDIIVFRLATLAELVKANYGYSSDFAEIDRNMDYIFNRINQKLQQNSLGYEIIDKQIVRVDNQYVHNQVVKTAVQLLHEQKFDSVSEEFLKAHEHYKNGDYKDAIVNAGKAFESVMKKICAEKKYQYDAKKDTASTLINILLKNEFIPEYLQNQFVGLRNTLQNSVPTLRNKFGGHGQGDEIVHVPKSIVTYTLNLCATNIVFLVERYKESRGG